MWQYGGRKAFLAQFVLNSLKFFLNQIQMKNLSRYTEGFLKKTIENFFKAVISHPVNYLEVDKNLTYEKNIEFLILKTNFRMLPALQG